MGKTALAQERFLELSGDEQLELVSALMRGSRLSNVMKQRVAHPKPGVATVLFDDGS